MLFILLVFFVSPCSLICSNLQSGYAVFLCLYFCLIFTVYLFSSLSVPLLHFLCIRRWFLLYFCFVSGRCFFGFIATSSCSLCLQFLLFLMVHLFNVIHFVSFARKQIRVIPFTYIWVLSSILSFFFTTRLLTFLCIFFSYFVNVLLVVYL